MSHRQVVRRACNRDKNDRPSKDEANRPQRNGKWRTDDGVERHDTLWPRSATNGFNTPIRALGSRGGSSGRYPGVQLAYWRVKAIRWGLAVRIVSFERKEFPAEC